MRFYNCLFIAMLLLGSQEAKEKATESVTNTALEKALEHVRVASENIERANKNNTEVNINYDGVALFNNTETFSSVMNTVGKQMMVFSINADNAKVNISFSGSKDMLEHKPIKGIFENGNEEPKIANGTLVSITKAKEDAFIYMLMECGFNNNTKPRYKWL